MYLLKGPTKVCWVALPHISSVTVLLVQLKNKQYNRLVLIYLKLMGNIRFVGLLGTHTHM